MSRYPLVVVAILYLVRTNAKFSTRIVGGSPAIDVNFPWMVSIVYYGRHVCGGSIINNQTILTAAHCIRGSDPLMMKIRVGTKMKSAGGALFPIASVQYHQLFRTSTMDYDIGMIRLAKELQFSERIQPISLPQYGEDITLGTNAIVAGWGFYTPWGPGAEYLQYAVVPIINQAMCNRLMNNAISDRMLCAGYLAGGIDACQMDSGGPLIVDNKLVGVVSWGISCALPNKPGVYTRVSELIPWVTNYLKQFNESLQ